MGPGPYRPLGPGAGTQGTQVGPPWGRDPRDPRRVLPWGRDPRDPSRAPLGAGPKGPKKGPPLGPGPKGIFLYYDFPDDFVLMYCVVFLLKAQPHMYTCRYVYMDICHIYSSRLFHVCCGNSSYQIPQISKSALGVLLLLIGPNKVFISLKKTRDCPRKILCIIFVDFGIFWVFCPF